MIIFKSEINEESVMDFIEANKEIEEGSTIYFSSNGGELGYADLLQHFFEKKKCHLVGFGTISSAGFILMADYPLTKELIKNTTGMVHLGEFQHYVKTSGLLDGYVKELKKEYKQIEENRASVYKEILTSIQFRNYKRGLDVFIPHEQFKSILQKDSKRSDQISNRVNRRTKRSKKIN